MVKNQWFTLPLNRGCSSDPLHLRKCILVLRKIKKTAVRLIKDMNWFP